MVIQDSPRTRFVLARLRSDIAAAKFELAALRFNRLLRKAYNPNQPRVPRGNSDGGQWSDSGGSSEGVGSTGVAMSDATPGNFWKPGAKLAQAGSRGGRFSRTIRVGNRSFEATQKQETAYAYADLIATNRTTRIKEIDPNWQPRASFSETMDGAIRARRADAEEAEAKLAELGRRSLDELITIHRNANNSRDLFGRKIWPDDKGTVAAAKINGLPVIGVNSGAPGYTNRDRADAESYRARLVAKYPKIMSTANLGEIPNDALFHAEDTLMFRAAKYNRGTLAG